MNRWMSREGLGVFLLMIGAIVLTIWNLGTKIDLSNPSATFLNLSFIIGIVLLLAGIFVLRSKK